MLQQLARHPENLYPESSQRHSYKRTKTTIIIHLQYNFLLMQIKSILIPTGPLNNDQSWAIPYDPRGFGPNYKTESDIDKQDGELRKMDLMLSQP